jgi:predicted RNA-binding protein with PUA-like domain
MQYWIFKTEPSTYSIDDLRKDKKTEWWGIRNYQVRNFLRDSLNVGDKILIYHSNAEEIGIVGTATVASDAYPDTEQFRKESKYYDPKSKVGSPSWISRDIAYESTFPRMITLSELKKEKALKNLLILKIGNRLSITPLREKEYQYIAALATV